MAARSPELRLFISSTFVDLAAEREYLVKQIFPEIRAAARERGVEFTEIDLRWGITPQEAEEGKTIKTCLEEVDRCRPYFLGLIGSRYGWQPDAEDIRKDPELLEQFPWVELASQGGMSVTEMEMSYGALAHQDKPTNALFYSCQDPSAREDQLTKLCDRIRKSGYPFVDGLANIEALGAKVREDMLRIINEQFPIKAEPSPIEAERSANEAYAHTRRRAYVANPEYIQKLTTFANDTDAELKPLVIVGKSGGGKSSLVAYWSNEYRTQNPDVFVITHYVGAAHSSPASVIRHLMLEIKERGNFDDPIPEQADELERDLPQWLAKLPDEKIVIAIDAVNQLEDPRGHGLNWLPLFIPPNIHLILSTTDDVYGTPDEEHTLAHRQWNEFTVRALTQSERHEVTKYYLSQYHKSLTRPQLEALATSDKCESPLFLRTVLEELRIFGKYRQIDERIEYYLASEDTDDLFQRVLERMEEDYGLAFVRSVMSLVGASRHGLSENELLGLLTHIKRYELSRLLHALDYHLIRNAGLLNFFHSYLRRAVERRYNHGDHECQSSHRQLAEYFHKQPADKRRADEEPYNWQRANDAKGLQECLSDVPLLMLLLEEHRRQEIIGYWKMLKEHVSLKEMYREIARTSNTAAYTIEEQIKINKFLGDGLTAATEYEIAEILLRQALTLATTIYGHEAAEVAKAKNDLGTVLYFKSDFDEAEKILREALEVKQKILGSNDFSFAQTLNDLGAVLYSTGKYIEAEQAYRGALNIYMNNPSPPLREAADTSSNLGTVLFNEKNYLQSKQYFLEAFAIFKKMYGATHSALLPCISNLAMVEERMDNIEISESYRKEYIRQSELFYGKQSVEMCLALGNMGVFYSRIGRHEEAVELQTTAQELRLQILGEDHYYSVLGYLNLGCVFLRLGKITEGVLLLETYLPKLISDVGESNVSVQNTQNTWKELHQESFLSYKSKPSLI